jgi:hypothetical protein
VTALPLPIGAALLAELFALGRGLIDRADGRDA